MASGNKAWELSIDVAGNAVRCDDKTFPLPALPWPRPELRMLLDGSVIESFIGGREALTSRVYTLKPGETQLEVEVEGAGHVDVEAWPMKTISADRLTT